MELRNAVVLQGMGTGFCAVVSFALLAYLSRAFGVQEFGLYVSVLSASTLALVLIEGGWPTLLYRETAHSRDDAQMRRLLGHATAYIVAVSGALAAIPFLASRLGLAQHLRMDPADLAAAFLCMGCVALMNAVSGRLRGMGHFGREAIWQSGGRLLSAGMIVLAVAVWGPASATVFHAWAAGLALMVLGVGWRWLAPPQLAGWRSASALASPFLVYEGLMAVLLRSDVAWLGALGASPTALSNYAACTRLTEAAILMFAPVSNVLLRSLVRTPSGVARRDLAIRGAWFAFACGCVACILALAIGEQIMPAIFGNDFDTAGRLLPWVVAMLPFSLANLVLLQAVLANGAERSLLGRLGVGVVALLLGLALGLRMDGERGAAIGSMLAQATLLVLIVPIALRRMRTEPPR